MTSWSVIFLFIYAVKLKFSYMFPVYFFWL
uniref:Uncharacterized protein n=1 Tax=Arundo donax TaxID=35708 RepID=A0A0A9G7F3_ARUDO